MISWVKLAVTFCICLLCTGCIGIQQLEHYYQNGGHNLYSVTVLKGDVNNTIETTVLQPDSIPSATDSSITHSTKHDYQHLRIRKHVLGAIEGLAIGFVGGVLLGAGTSTLMAHGDNSAESSAWGGLIGGVVGGVIGVTYGAIHGAGDLNKSPE
jgi:hypothetical protein